jgi:hypothetical protein
MRYYHSLFAKSSAPKLPKGRLIRHIVATAFRRMLMVLGGIVLFGALTGVILSF